MAKKKQLDQKWIVGGVLALLLGGWWAWTSGGQQAKIAQIYEEGSSGGTVYETKGSWAYGKQGVDGDVIAALKAWKATIAGKETDNSLITSIDKKKAYCSETKFGTGQDYDPKKTYDFALEGRLSPKAMATTGEGGWEEVGKRKLTAYFTDNRGKVMATGSVDMPVLAQTQPKSAAGLAVDPGDEGGTTGSSGTNTSIYTGKSMPSGTSVSKVSVVANKEYLDKTALKLFRIKFCLNTSNTEAVDFELVDLGWMLDSRYLGPAEQVLNPVIIY